MNHFSTGSSTTSNKLSSKTHFLNLVDKNHFKKHEPLFLGIVNNFEQIKFDRPFFFGIVNNIEQIKFERLFWTKLMKNNILY